MLSRLIADLPNILAVSGPPDAEISAIVSDSRQVAPGTLFVAYRGVDADGHRYLQAAIERGAAAIVAEQAAAAPSDRPYIQVSDGREALAWLMASRYGHPSRAFPLVGITGTDGKTTTANLIYSILRAAGLRTGLVSTVNAVIGDAVYDTGLHTTTPDAPEVQHFLAEMREAGTEIAVLEVTSHGLAQHRVTGCAFDIAVLTNITHEHLDFHGSAEAYRAAKRMLFTATAANPHKPEIPKTAILNRDDSSYSALASLPFARRIAYGVGEPRPQEPDALCDLTLAATGIHHSPSGTSFVVHQLSGRNMTPEAHFHLKTSLIGMFNISNILAAVGAAMALGVSADAVRAGVSALKGVSGRMELIDRGQRFTAIVDFAHTPNALENALAAVRPLCGPGGRIIVVFGSAGLRDREKRRLMGEVAARMADFTVLTAEDPRTEDIAAILLEVAGACASAGRIEGRDYVLEPDRQRALQRAVTEARPGDIVIACGKGHERSMCFGTTEYPWTDQAALAWALEVAQGHTNTPPPFVLPTWK